MSDFNFERLDVWHEAVEFSTLIYSLTRSFPKEELFGLALQLRRAANSIVANIAEGASRSSRIDNARFVEIATGSLFEVIALIEVALRQSYITTDQHKEVYSTGAKIGRQLSGLRRSLLAKADPKR